MLKIGLSSAFLGKVCFEPHDSLEICSPFYYLDLTNRFLLLFKEAVSEWLDSCWNGDKR